MKLILISVIALVFHAQISTAAESKAKFSIADLIGGITNTLGKLNKLSGKSKETIKNYCDAVEDAPKSTVSSLGIRRSCREKKLDLLFLIEGSSSVSAANFDLVKDFVAEVVEQFDVQADRTRVAVAQFANEAVGEVAFNDHYALDDLQKAIRRLQPKGGSTLTSAALQQVGGLLAEGNGARADAAKALVTITYRKGAGDVGKAARALRKRFPQLHMLSVGVEMGPAVGIEEAGNFISGILGSFGKEGKGFANLKLPAAGSMELEALGDLASDNKAVVLACSPQELDDDKAQLLAARICAQVDETCRKSYADILFLLESPAGDEALASVKALLGQAVQAQDVGRGRTRIAIGQYYDYRGARVATMNLRFTDDKNAIRRAIEGLKPVARGAYRRTAQALYDVYHYESGGGQVRGGVDTVVVLFTAGTAIDYPRGAADTLGWAKGITVVGVGVGGASQRDLDQVTYNNKARQLRVGAWPELASANAQERLARAICEAKPAIRLMEGLQAVPGCFHGVDVSKWSAVAPDYTNNSPRSCFAKCRAQNRPTEVIALKAHSQCLCGGKDLIKSRKADHHSWCHNPCMNKLHNQNNIMCGGGIALSLYTPTQ